MMLREMAFMSTAFICQENEVSQVIIHINVTNRAPFA
ncbi:Uncharacterised protein [Sphingobacterium spiritivorum]|uniref:Uncharacterized protein n=1 Tax=Sphingobacterium spiritivorum TaxID=258 RepID=A0A380CTS1_SPHSI|nr:Uncharacterised protein [Sphingobacterium spiritivorum]